MKFTDFLTKDSCVMDLKAKSKEEAIRELAGVLGNVGKVTDTADFVKHLLEREALGSTGIGKGVAVPHCPTKSVKELAIAFGKSSKGIPFGSADSREVRYIFLMGTNPEHLGVYLRMLANLSKLLTVRAFKEDLDKASTPEQLVEAFRKFEKP
ncbi:MAG: PTS sugar transporter subunit IIA [Deltaproteobacteria bacterium]